MENDYSILLRSLDEVLDDADQKALGAALEAQPALRQEQARLLALREQLCQYTAEFTPQFADRVMDRLQSEQHKTHIIAPTLGITDLLTQWFPRVAAAAAIFIAMVVINTYWQEGKLSLDTLAGINYLDDIENDDTAAFYFVN